MRTWWAWASVLALCVSPAVAQARDRGGDRGDARERHPSPSRHSDQGQRRDDRGNRSSGGDRAARGWNRGPSSDSAPRGGGNTARNDRPGRQDWGRFSRGDAGRSYSDRGYSRRNDSGRNDSGRTYADRGNAGRNYSDRNYSDRRYSDRGYSYGNRNSRDSWGGWNHDRRDDRRSYRGYRSYGYRPRYPAYYRYGYFHRHGYYFPRYYFDYEVYPAHASVRMLVEPSETEVYVDGYYAGVVDDFDGLFQRLNVSPGPHQITLRLDGYQTWSAEVVASPEGTLNLRHDMVPGPSGEDVGRYGEDSGGYQGPPADEPPDGRYEEPPPDQP